MRKFLLTLRIWLATALLFGILYAIITVICTYLGFGTPLIFAMFAVVVVLAQYMIGPIIVEKSMGVRYVSPQEAPNLHAMIDELASALYKLVYGSANMDKKQVKEVEGVKAFFVNDISDASNEISDLEQIDLDRDGIISETELAELKNTEIRIKTGSKITELISTHPNMVKRIKRLAELSDT